MRGIGWNLLESQLDHLLHRTVIADTPTRAATWVLNAPGSAQASTIRHRNAYACVAARAPRTNSCRCASVTTKSGPDLGRHVLATAESYNYATDFKRGTQGPLVVADADLRPPGARDLRPHRPHFRFRDLSRVPPVSGSECLHSPACRIPRFRDDRYRADLERGPWTNDQKGDCTRR
ncbi:hypothetical protein NONO_c35000 [Nocardia nova SH22a]|uniref:Uncharacterized protein n=1 Tax=Nocardia nova SH22a TaxID=1415166 RepID=W5TGE3_9NOCA|nr:hypothetical protein NONO_c35000 [Nocardia nova SH22a]